ncbi:cytochrome c oxidase assembly factor 7 homolog [Varroa destructor]|uniref:Cytochrome c oxidase assembly factor 7 n=1 Tax=Varroa destructor TaxID=109461 RepID=A0A7M7MFX8_VARDE|nr:cytochrome c oxidase assembly factor 7 homolog [Varroa destructor]
MPYNMKDEEEVKQFLENLGIEYRFACLKEKKPDGCHLLGDYLEAIRKDFRRAAQVYQDNCNERGHGHSCHKFGNYAYFGKGTPEDRAKSFEYQIKSCNAGYPKGCVMAGLHLTAEKGSGVPQDIEKGISLLKRACDMGSHDGCHQASGICLTGRGVVAQNMKEAFELAVKGCDLGNIYSCHNVALMYERGTGVEKDKVKAEQYRSKVVDYKEQCKSNYTLKMEEGID